MIGTGDRMRTQQEPIISWNAPRLWMYHNIWKEQKYRQLGHVRYALKQCNYSIRCSFFSSRQCTENCKVWRIPGDLRIRIFESLQYKIFLKKQNTMLIKYISWVGWRWLIAELNSVITWWIKTIIRKTISWITFYFQIRRHFIWTDTLTGKVNMIKCQI